MKTFKQIIDEIKIESPEECEEKVKKNLKQEYKKRIDEIEEDTKYLEASIKKIAKGESDFISIGASNLLIL